MADHFIMLDDVDLSEPQTNRLDYLFWLKGKYPDFQVNLFVIPGRSTWGWIEELDKIDWVQLCMHGWNHDEKENIEDWMIKEWMSHDLPSVYKGPNWKVSDYSKENLFKNGFTIIQKPLSDNYFQGHIWSPVDLDKISELLKSGVQCKKLC